MEKYEKTGGWNDFSVEPRALCVWLGIDRQLAVEALFRDTMTKLGYDTP
jgi:hypothetical protein